MDNFLVGMVAGAMLTFALTRLAEFVSMMLPWKRAYMSGAAVTVLSILRMQLRGCPAAFLVDAYCALAHSGHDITIQQVEACYSAHKHEVSENDMGAFIDMVKDFAADHPITNDSASA